MNEGGYRRYTPAPGQPPVRTNLVWAIAALVICFWPAGIVAVVYAVKARNRLGTGDYVAAVRYSRLAKIWSWISLAAAFVIVIALFIAARGAGSGGTTTLTPVYWALGQYRFLMGA